MAAKRIPTKRDMRSASDGEKETLVEAINAIGKASRKLSASGLNRKGIVVLLQHETKLSARDINATLDGLEVLEKRFCR